MRRSVGRSVVLIVLAITFAPVVRPAFAQEQIPVGVETDEVLAMARKVLADSEEVRAKVDEIIADSRELEYIGLVVQTIVHQLLEADRPEAAARLLSWACIEDTLAECLTSDNSFKMNSITIKTIMGESEGNERADSSRQLNAIATVVALIESRVGIDLDVVDLAPLFVNGG